MSGSNPDLLSPILSPRQKDETLGPRHSNKRFCWNNKLFFGVQAIEITQQST